MVPVNLGKKIPNDALEILWVSTDNMVSPGTINKPYETPSIFSILDPIAEPKTTKYKAVEMTGDAIL